MDDHSAVGDQEQPGQSRDGGGLARLTVAVERGAEETAALSSRLGSVLGALDAREPRLPPEILSLPGQVESIGAGLSEVRLRLRGVDELGARMERIEELLDAVAQQMAADAARSAAGDVEDRLAALEQRVAAAMADQTGAVADLIGPVADRLGEVRDAAGHSAATSEALARALDSTRSHIEQRLNAIDGELRAVTGAATSAVADATGALGVATDRLGSLVRTELVGARLGIGASVDDVARNLEAIIKEQVSVLSSTVGAEVQRRLDQAALADLFESRSRELTSSIEDALATLEERGGVLEEGMRGLWTRIDLIDAVLSGLQAWTDGVPEHIVSETTSALGGLIGGVETRVAALSAAVASLPEVTADTTRAALQQARTDIAGGVVDAVRVEVAEVIAGIPAAIDASVGPLPDQLGAVVAHIATQLLARVQEHLAATSTTVTDEVRHAVAAEVSAAIAGGRGAMEGQVADTLAQIAGEIVRSSREVVQTAATALLTRTESSTDEIAAYLSDAVTAAITRTAPDVAELVGAALGRSRDGSPPPTLDAIVEAFGTAALDATRAVSESAADGLRSAGVDLATLAVRQAAEETAASLADTVGAVMRDSISATADAMSTHIIEVIAGAAAEVIPEEVERAARSAVAEDTAGAIRSAVAAAVTDGVAQAVGDGLGPQVLETVHAAVEAATAGRPGDEPSGVTAGLLGAVSSTLSDFGEQIDADLDAVGTRMGQIAEVLERVVGALETTGGGRGEIPRDTFDLLRQIAAETSKQVRSLNEGRRTRSRRT